ncbi:MAG: hypothetical protein Q6366_010795 [Candidatus Freyarchaeota archaeon]
MFLILFCLLVGDFMARKPLGVQILSVSILLASLVFLVLGYYFYRLFAPSYNLFAPFPGIPQLYWLPLVFVSFGVLGLVVGLGFWGVRRWAYLLTFGCCVVFIGFGVFLVGLGFLVLGLLDVFSVELFSVSAFLLLGVTGRFFASLTLGAGLIIIMLSVAVLRFLTGVVK